MPGKSLGDSDPVNLQGRRDDVVEFTRAVGDDSSKYHRPNRQADQGLPGPDRTLLRIRISANPVSPGRPRTHRKVPEQW
jgi:hypothetical protein